MILSRLPKVTSIPGPAAKRELQLDLKFYAFERGH